jgi:Monooxygenase af470-like
MEAKMTNAVFPGRFTASIEGDVVVFLIGSRLNRLRSLPRMLQVGRQMTRMQSELMAQPDRGCLHMENFFGRVTLSVQYWRDFESLERYARAADAEHLGAWREFNRLVRDSGDIGIWHETYLVPAGSYETVYGNMPAFGLARAGTHTPAGRHSTAASRAQRESHEPAPVEAY